MCVEKWNYYFANPISYSHEIDEVLNGIDTKMV